MCLVGIVWCADSVQKVCTQCVDRTRKESSCTFADDAAAVNDVQLNAVFTILHTVDVHSLSTTLTSCVPAPCKVSTAWLT